MNEPKIKCIKCGLLFKDRNDPEDNGIHSAMCFNCRFVWRVIAMTIQSLPDKINRVVTVHLDGVQIRKKRKDEY